ncbi:hypothetical protein [Vulcanisaeta sp. JCM 16161]|uniref:hypothetical protein n=1 Tax=Vulcanisaeta sp. JCM 16161 TaxID=1295372 RepID=UPI001FB23C0D|nr:hypothetical protein [Vulcanisaeta sp. JCM 16161]
MGEVTDSDKARRYGINVSKHFYNALEDEVRLKEYDEVREILRRASVELRKISESLGEGFAIRSIREDHESR